MSQTFDYIVIGAGTAGCLLANRLSENPCHSVLLLEAGPKDSSPLIRIPIGFGVLYAHKKLNWCLQSEPEVNLNNRCIDQPRGKVLGGSSAINGMMYVRGQSQDYDHWAELGNDGWSYKELLPYFLRSEDQSRGANQYHHTGGELPVSDVRYRPQLAEQYLLAAEQADIRRNHDINAEQQSGIDYTQLAQKNGSRYSSARAFLPPRGERKNLSVLTQAQVQRICLEGDTATAVEVEIKGRVQRFAASKEIVLSAGAFHSPQILMLSGIGSAGELSKHNIPLLHNFPAVGQHLQEHLGVEVVYSCDKGHSIRDEFAPLQLLKNLVKYVFKRDGLLTFNGALISGFVHTEEQHQQRPNCQLVFSPAATDSSDGDNRIKIIKGVTSMAYPLRPDARGSVTLHSNKITDAPQIQHNFLASERDQQEMIDAVKLQRKIFSQPAMAAYLGKEILPGTARQTDKEILDYIRQHALGCYHPVGSCRMGSAEDCVVDARLRVHGLNKLRIVDGSIMPALVSGNTNAPITMIAEKAAAMILADNQTDTTASASSR